ncbi:hypothetical protein [Bacillus cereus group sp. BfR-BA-01380]|uniref:hypothetical protein n=1 Tax=Bacillus cereus group sp. BfR-BA-01380 TaxID=2920324 RepID=UPI001F58C604|nr:hypothetical protein [Bacillus cereus group sp. BfR-BA-01380]
MKGKVAEALHESFMVKIKPFVSIHKKTKSRLPKAPMCLWEIGSFLRVHRYIGGNGTFIGASLTNGKPAQLGFYEQFSSPYFSSLYCPLMRDKDSPTIFDTKIV